MILPDKSITPDRALIAVGGEVLKVLAQPQTVSHVWERIKPTGDAPRRLDFGWFVLALDLLYALGAIDLRDGLLHRAEAA